MCLENGEVKKILNDLGEIYTPSCLYFSEYDLNNESVYIGKDAEFYLDEQNYIYDTKRMLGLEYNNNLKIQNNWTFNIEKNDDNKLDQIKILLNFNGNNKVKNYITPILASSLILNYLKNFSEIFRNKK